jgi:hypothetical protein
MRVLCQCGKRRIIISEKKKATKIAWEGKTNERLRCCSGGDFEFRRRASVRPCVRASVRPCVVRAMAGTTHSTSLLKSDAIFLFATVSFIFHRESGVSRVTVAKARKTLEI